ncbi:MAG TPA: hypothetical protein VHP64_02935 [Candidatus Limnocylindria bacterium]|nr:hypothetical protein [Candidatus Limnocylindria bacterium]
MTAPAWAAELVEAVCADASVAPPRLTWRNRQGAHSTGVARRQAGTISVRAGSDPLDQRLTLLHELAHWLAVPVRRRGRRTAHHDLAFYRIAFELYRRHGLSDADALRLEAGHYPSSLGHAAALGVPGAAAALRARRAAQRSRPPRRWKVLVPEHPVRLGRAGRWHVCATCGQRVVGSNLVRVRRARRSIRHVLMVAVPA